MVIVLFPLLPKGIVKVCGDAVSVKFAKLTVSVMVVVALRLPEVPVMAMDVVPPGAVRPAVSVRTLLAVPGFGLKEAITPAGSLDVVSLTLPENPLLGVIMIVLAPLPTPLTMVTALGEAERLKL